MRRTMRLAVVGVLALGVVAGFVPSASASSGGDRIQGGCGFIANGPAIVTGSENVGAIFADSVTRNSAHLPTGATVECWIQVNGIKQASTDLVATGFGVQANAKQISFSAGPADIVEEITCVTYADGTTEPCQGPCLCDAQLPLQVVVDLLNEVFDVADSMVCPQLVKLAGSYGSVTIAPDGDVFVADPLDLFGGAPVHDCPPYSS